MNEVGVTGRTAKATASPVRRSVLQNFGSLLVGPAVKGATSQVHRAVPRATDPTAAGLSALAGFVSLSRSVLSMRPRSSPIWPRTCLAVVGSFTAGERRHGRRPPDAA